MGCSREAPCLHELPAALHQPVPLLMSKSMWVDSAGTSDSSSSFSMDVRAFLSCQQHNDWWPVLLRNLQAWKTPNVCHNTPSNIRNSSRKASQDYNACPAIACSAVMAAVRPEKLPL